MANNFQCFFTFSLVTGFRLILILCHGQPPVQGCECQRTSSGPVRAAMALLIPKSVVRSSSSEITMTSHPFFLNSFSIKLSFQAQERTSLRERRGARDVSRLAASSFPNRGTLDLLGVAKVPLPGGGKVGSAICTSIGLRPLGFPPTGLHPPGGDDAVVLPSGAV